MFLGFPRRIDWFRAMLSRDEVLDILYINWDWWLRLSGGSRRPCDAAQRIQQGKIPGVSAAEHEPVVAALRGDDPPSELIAVTAPSQTPVVLVEGHARLTAYALYPNYLPEELQIFVGVSDQITNWCNF